MERYKLSDKVFSDLKLSLKTGKQNDLASKFKCTLENGKVFHKGREVVSRSRAEKLIHDELLNGKSTLAINTVHANLREKYIGIPRRYVKKVLDTIQEYQLMKRKPFYKSKGVPKQKREGKAGQMIAFHPNAVGIDLMEMHDSMTAYNYLCVCVHALSGYVIAKPMKSKTAQTTLTTFKGILKEFEKRFGKEGYLLFSDLGKEFFNKTMAAFLKLKGITHNEVRAATQVEKCNSQLARQIGFLMGSGLGWNKSLRLAQEKLNNTVSRKTGVKPIDFTAALVKKYKQKRGGYKKRIDLKLNAVLTPRKQPEFNTNVKVRHLTHHALKSTFIKSYASLVRPKKGIWTRRLYVIEKKKGPTKFNDHSTYFVNKKWRPPWELMLCKEVKKLDAVPKSLPELDIKPKNKPKKRHIIKSLEPRKRTQAVPPGKKAKPKKQKKKDYFAVEIMPTRLRRRKKVNYKV